MYKHNIFLIFAVAMHVGIVRFAVYWNLP